LCSGDLMATWTCKASRTLPLNTEQSWDGSAAHSAMMDHFGIGGDHPDAAGAAKGYLLVDTTAPELRGSYSLPFATLIDGTLTALISGCRAAASRLPQKDGVSAEQQTKARNVLDAYFAKTKGKSDNAQPLDGEYLKPADWLPIRLQTAAERAQAGASDPEELLRLAKQRAQDPSVFDEFPPTFFSGIVSTNALDSYYTQMHRSSLENFAADLTEGRTLLDSHNSGSLSNSIGYSLSGRYIAGGGDGKQRTQADFFSAPTDDNAAAFIRKMQAGMVRDLSAGFYGGQWLCNLDGNEMGRWNEDPEKRCMHWPGMEYDGQTATATIHNARLAEASAVYDGSTPGSMILRARQMSEAGLIEPEMARRLEVSYRIKLPASHHAYAGAGRSLAAAGRDTTEEDHMAEKPEGQAAPPVDTPTDPGILQAFHRSIAAALAEVPLPPESRADEPATLIRRLGAELIELRPLRDKVETLETRVRELEPQAEDGETYRKDLIDDTLAEGVRALGDAFAVEANRQLLAGQSLAVIKAQRDQWRALGNGRFVGGRATLDQGEPRRNGDAPGELTPAGAYAGG
jgi:hypothetical protein